MHDSNEIDLLSAYLDDELTATERDALELELQASVTLRATLEQLRHVRDWARSYPGRQPKTDVWEDVAATIEGSAGSGAVASPTRRSGLVHRVAAGLAGVLPSFSWSNAAKRAAVVSLAGIAVAGMGRSYMLQQETGLLEEKTRAQELRLLEIASGASWRLSAAEWRDRHGEQLTVRCDRLGTIGHVWGTDVYTDDSSVCTAAVHAGLITPREGGLVTIEIRPGQRGYAGTTRNAVESRDYGRWSGSFVFVDPDALGDEPSQPHAEMISWSEGAEGLRTWNGTQVAFACPPDGEASAVWGSGPYTDDSSICSAAVHAGLITFEDGGVVTIEIRPGEQRYRGTRRHDVESYSYGAYSGSFVFVGPAGVLEAPPFEPELIDWEKSATDLRAWRGLEVPFTCPMLPTPAEIGTVWGTGTYTDDSSICGAALHAGAITEDGGLVVIEIGSERDRFDGSRRRGVESLDYGRWGASFTVVGGK